MQYYLLTTRWTTIFTIDISTATYQSNNIKLKITHKLNHQKSLLTCLHFKGVGVLLLNGVCELKASVTAVVSVGVFSQNIGEEQVTVQAHWHPLVLCYGHNGCRERKKGKTIKTHLFNLIWCVIADRQQKKWCSRGSWESQAWISSSALKHRKAQQMCHSREKSSVRWRQDVLH